MGHVEKRTDLKGIRTRRGSKSADNGECSESSRVAAKCEARGLHCTAWWEMEWRFGATVALRSIGAMEGNGPGKRGLLWMHGVWRMIRKLQLDSRSMAERE